MTDSNYSHITLVVDRSGSMSSILSDAQGGLDTFLNEQFNFPGRLTVTLVDFDNIINVSARMATDKPNYLIEPRGTTALFDAVGLAIGVTGEDLAALPEESRPEHVLFVIVTDGMENASREWPQSKLRDKIEEQKNVYNWKFLFIGADESAWQGVDLGTHSVSFASNVPGAASASYAAASATTTAIRSRLIKDYDDSTSVV